ncbi:MAG: hypothetical protein ABSH14_11830 [Verrucomicrobiia bacterium]|jgi:hypothetical protein
MRFACPPFSCILHGMEALAPIVRFLIWAFCAWLVAVIYLLIYESYRSRLQRKDAPTEDERAKINQFLEKYAIQTGLLAGVIATVSPIAYPQGGNSGLQGAIVLLGIGSMWLNWKYGL